jgi:hypothetical protein
VSWVVYSYQGTSNDLKVKATGSGDVDELADEFSDGSMQYAFVRVLDPTTRLSKFVLINWVSLAAFLSMFGAIYLRSE